MPNAVTELFATTWARRAADLTGATYFRLSVAQTVVGGALQPPPALPGPVLRVQFSTDGGTTWGNLEATGSTAADLSVETTRSVKVGAWGQLAAAAASEVQLRIVGQGGDGAADPAFRYIGIEFK